MNIVDLTGNKLRSSSPKLGANTDYIIARTLKFSSSTFKIDGALASNGAGFVSYFGKNHCVVTGPRSNIPATIRCVELVCVLYSTNHLFCVCVLVYCLQFNVTPVYIPCNRHVELYLLATICA